MSSPLRAWAKFEAFEGGTLIVAPLRKVRAEGAYIRTLVVDFERDTLKGVPSLSRGS